MHYSIFILFFINIYIINFGFLPKNSSDYNHPFNTHNLCTLAILQYFGFFFMSSLDIHSNKSEYVHWAFVMKRTRIKNTQHRRLFFFFSIYSHQLTLLEFIQHLAFTSIMTKIIKITLSFFFMKTIEFLSINVPKILFIPICFKIFPVTLLSVYTLFLTFTIFRCIFQSDTSSHTIQFIKHIIEKKKNYRNESVINNFVHFEGDRKL